MMKVSNKKILLVEPIYNNKYPPLGLMKIATAHKLCGDEVSFHRGTSATLRDQHWDLIYIATLFTFQWRGAVETINFYAKGKSPVIVGGPLASLLPEDIERATGIKPHIGPYRGDVKRFKNFIFNDTNLSQLYKQISTYGVDFLPPDYGIFDDLTVPYEEALNESYILRTTKGCFRNCKFCAVKTLHPNLTYRIPLTPYISYIEKRWGPKRNLLLLDDNFLLSPKFDDIIDEICYMGFERGATLNRKKRCVDFNQGLDVRLLTKHHLKKLFTIALRPLRLAFDSISLANTYTKKIMWALETGFREISSYVLYNFEDSPADLYTRLRISSELNDKYNCRIYSFPMKYIPCNSKDRKYVSTKWTRRQIRGIQCILNAMHGIVPTNPSFFQIAFGDSLKEFLQIIQMPENYIIERSKYGSNGLIKQLESDYYPMSTSERSLSLKLIAGGKRTINKYEGNLKIQEFLKHYANENIYRKVTNV